MDGEAISQLGFNMESKHFACGALFAVASKLYSHTKIRLGGVRRRNLARGEQVEPRTHVWRRIGRHRKVRATRSGGALQGP
jgi:hypothetical protein